MTNVKYTEEQKKFLIDNNYMRTAQELADLFNKNFNTELTREKIKSFRGRYHLDSGLTGHFERGHTPHNKGKKQTDYMSKECIERTKTTRFKKGNIPSNHRKVNSERISKDGYIEIKIKEPNKWMKKHRYIYEKANGKIPDGYKVIFLDGNKQNLDLTNLKLVSDAQELIMNQRGLFTDDSDLTNTGTIISEVIAKGNKLKNDRLWATIFWQSL